jgi:hypothetical protein
MKNKEAISSVVKNPTLKMEVRKCALSNAEHRWNHREVTVFLINGPTSF